MDGLIPVCFLGYKNGQHDKLAKKRKTENITTVQTMQFVAYSSQTDKFFLLAEIEINPLPDDKF